MSKELNYLYFYVIGTNGSIIYGKTFGDRSKNANEQIQIASTLHTIDAMTSLIAPP